MATTRSVSDIHAPPSLTQQEHSEEKKQVCDKSLARAAIRSVIHIIPVLVTLALIAMSAKTVYYSDLDAFSTQDVALQAFQFAVKAHEILMTISITDIVLHRVRWDLLVVGEIPFGYLTSAYQLSRVEYLFSSQFWGAAWRLRKDSWHFRRLSLGLLIVLACILTLVVGPSSGVLMIPKLNWWPLEWPFASTSLSLFSSNREGDIRWPSTLEWHDCGGNLTCPGTSCVDILSWASGLTWNNVRAEVPFITGGDNFYRWVVSNTTDYASGWTATTSPMMDVASTLGSYWNWIVWQSLRPASRVMQPKLSISFADNGPILQPFVQVQCSAHKIGSVVPQITLPNDRLHRVLPASSQMDEEWPVPWNYTNVNPDLYNYDLFWAKLPVKRYQAAPSAALMFVMLDENYTRTAVPCSILAHWVPSDLFITPMTDRDIHSKSPNPLDLLNRSTTVLTKENQIFFSEDWWASLKVGGDPTSIDEVIHGIYGRPNAHKPWVYFAGSQGLAYRVSTIMGMFLTDAIARYTPNTLDVVFQDPGNGTGAFAQLVNQFETPHLWTPLKYDTWRGYARAHPSQWREVVIQISRYGYAWSFDGILVKLAASILAIHLILALGHVVLIMCGRWTSGAWDNIGEMIALALRSDSSSAPPNCGAGVKNKTTWAQSVSVRTTGQNLELMFGTAARTQLPSAGEEYG